MEDSGLFSLEEDNANELFIMQTPRENLISYMEVSQSENNCGILGDGSDFTSPCSSIVHAVKGTGPVYEDISDDESVFMEPIQTAKFQ